MLSKTEAKLMALFILMLLMMSCSHTPKTKYHYSAVSLEGVELNLTVTTDQKVYVKSPYITGDTVVFNPSTGIIVQFDQEQYPYGRVGIIKELVQTEKKN